MQQEEKRAILLIIQAASKYNLADPVKLGSVVAQYEANEDFAFTAFGGRFLERARAVIKGKSSDDNCILCGKHKASNRIVCDVCVSQLQESVGDAVKKSKSGSHSEALEQEGEADNQKDLFANIPEEQRDLYAKIHEEQRASDRYTEDLIRNLDASMDRLASRKAVRSSNRMLLAILVISLVNTISIVAIAIIVLRQLNMI